MVGVLSTFFLKPLDKLAIRHYTIFGLAIRQRIGGDNMYPNLLGQKAYRHLTDGDMAKIIGVSRTAYQQKIKSGRFSPEECKAFCTYFGKRFEYLFADDGSEYAS